jgi:hypothetical protein
MRQQLAVVVVLLLTREQMHCLDVPSARRSGGVIGEQAVLLGQLLTPQQAATPWTVAIMALRQSFDVDGCGG